MGKIIGIDLGTTNSCVAVMEGGNAVVIPNAEGARTTPSVVGFSKNGERLVGQTAKRQAIANPERTISSIKRHMGSDYKVDIDGKKYTPQEISAMILQKLKTDAEAYLGQPVTEAVITVPAYFTDSQRQATKDAGQIAGLTVKRIINEPTAAALSYGIDKEDDQRVMVYDLGGGTFDVSIIEMGDGVQQVLATAGNNRLGGDDFDQRIINWMVEEFKKTEGIDLSNDKMAVQRLKDAAEKAKIELSSTTTTNINIPFITADATGAKHLDMNLTVAKFNELTKDLVDATMGPVQQALSDSGLSPSDLNKILMVGGSSRIPAVQEAVRQKLGKEPFKGINPDECVALGAAYQGGVLGGEVKDVLLLDDDVVNQTIPLILCAIRWGWTWGLGTGLVFGTLKFFLAGGTAVNWQSMLLDYSVAYMFVGFAGLLRGKSKTAWLAALVGCFGRFVIHFISGVTVYAQYMPEEFMGMTMTSPVFYSVLYNGTYMLPNTILAIVICALLMKPAAKLPSAE